ncbi:MAG: hypothetical protein HY741_23360 [Chloroflexi bacterium]|nr:hypothetical protein [Chloroflexota bacterium]
MNFEDKLRAIKAREEEKNRAGAVERPRQESERQKQKAEMENKKKADIDQLGEKASTLFTPPLTAINRVYLNGTGKIYTGKNYENEKVSVALYWNRVKSGNYEKGNRIYFEMTLKGKAELLWGDSHWGRKEIDLTRTDWEEKLAEEIHLIASSNDTSYDTAPVDYSKQDPYQGVMG